MEPYWAGEMRGNAVASAERVVKQSDFRFASNRDVLFWAACDVSGQFVS